MHPEARRLLAELALAAHPEGGYFRETYRSARRISTPSGERSALTSIVFLLTGDSFSAFHSLRSDETWHFYRGDPLELTILRDDGALERHTLAAGGPWQAAIPAGAHFAAAVAEPDGYALVGCDVAPGFEFSDFALDARQELSARFPAHAALVCRFTRERSPSR